MEIRKRQARNTSICEGKEQNSYQNAMIKFSACRLNHENLSTFISRYSYFHDNKRHIENESRFRYTFEGMIWDLIVSVPDHCLSFYFWNKLWL